MESGMMTITVWKSLWDPSLVYSQNLPTLNDLWKAFLVRVQGKLSDLLGMSQNPST